MCETERVQMNISVLTAAWFGLLSSRTFETFCLMSSAAEDQQARLQLLRLRRAQRSAMDGQDPKLHLRRVSRQPQWERLTPIVNGRGVGRSLRAETQQTLDSAGGCLKFGDHREQKCLVAEGEYCPCTSLPVAQQSAKLSLPCFSRSPTLSSLLSAPSSAPPAGMKWRWAEDKLMDCTTKEMLSYLSCKWIKAISLAIQTVGSIFDFKRKKKKKER